MNVERKTLPSKAAGRLASDVTLIAANFPDPPPREMVRENILSTIDDVFNEGIQVLSLEGAEEIGKTTLLAQFAKRHPTNTISIFIKPSTWFAYDPQLVLRDLCNQIHFILNGAEIPNEQQTDEAFYRQLLFGLFRLARQKCVDFYFVVDGFEDTPKESQAMAAIIGLLPIGASRIKCLIASEEEHVRLFLRRGIQHKTFVLSGFALEETIAYFWDLSVEKRFVDELYKVGSKGVPGQIASVRRLLEAGITPDALLNELPERLPNFFELEWKAIDLTNDTLLNMLALISQTGPKHSIGDLALILNVSADGIRALLTPIGFVRLPKLGNEIVEFISDRFRRIVSERLSSRRARVRERASRAPYRLFCGLAGDENLHGRRPDVCCAAPERRSEIGHREPRARKAKADVLTGDQGGPTGL